MAPLTASDSVQFVKGVGPRRAALLARAGIHRVRDLLTFFPTRYKESAGLLTIDQLEPDQRATVCGEITRVRGRWPQFAAEVMDGTGSCWLRWFQGQRGGHRLYVGAVVAATGVARLYNDRLELAHPRIKIYESDEPLPHQVGPELDPVYPPIAGIEPRTLRQIIAGLLKDAALNPRDPVPANVRVRRSLLPRLEALRTLHQPRNQTTLDAARQRFAFEELFLLEVSVALRRRRYARRPGFALPVDAALDQRIRGRFPFALTAGQDRVIAEMQRDLANREPMTRLLQGDVGTGKTVVALYGCLAAVAHQRQAAFVAPTEILSRQHYANLLAYLAGSRVRVGLLTGSQRPEDRTATRRALAAGEIDLVVGTHSLLREETQFARLALIVIDEQHRFGVHQRAFARQAERPPHLLVMSATPIPRSLALTYFGHLDVSLLDERPANRGAVRTHLVKGADFEALMASLRPRLAAGEQAFVVCPRIRHGAAGDGPALRSAERVYEELQAGAGRDVPVGLVHGQRSAEANAATLAAFAAGALRVLVATTMIEIGVDVPRATVMVVEQAERFGLAQLHQLRGRIGRGAQAGDCYLVLRSDGAEARTRLEVLTQTRDGFAIAEADLRQRGPGQILGVRQHGLPELRFANLVEDWPLLQQARDDARALVDADPELRQPANQVLRTWLTRHYRQRGKLIDAA
jgi:ATP-dependent DNA helicase RecG